MNILNITSNIQVGDILVNLYKPYGSQEVIEEWSICTLICGYDTYMENVHSPDGVPSWQFSTTDDLFVNTPDELYSNKVCITKYIPLATVQTKYPELLI